MIRLTLEIGHWRVSLEAGVPDDEEPPGYRESDLTSMVETAPPYVAAGMDPYPEDRTARARHIIGFRPNPERKERHVRA